MEHKKILNLLNKASGFKFVTRNWNIVNYQSNPNYSVGNQIIYSTGVLKYNLCAYNDAYILERDDASIIGLDLPTEVAFKNCAPFIKCITKINVTTIDDAEDLNLVMPTYSLLEQNSNYSDTTGSLPLYSKDKAINFNANIEDNNGFKYFKYKAKLLGNTEAYGTNRILKNTIILLLKYLSSFRRSHEMLLVNCKVELKLNWTNHCFLSANGNDNDDVDSVL